MAKGFGQLVLSPKQEREAKILRQSVLKHFQYLPGPPRGEIATLQFGGYRYDSDFGGAFWGRWVCRH